MMKEMCLVFGAVLLGILAVSSVWGDVGRATEPPTVDGRLDDACWKSAEWHSDFRYMKAYKKPGAIPYKTEFAVVADERAVYVGVRCYDPDIADLRTRKTSMWCGETVELFLSPGGTTFEFYHFAANPRCNDDYAAFFSEGGIIQPDPYAPTWTRACAFEEAAWTAEFRFPLSAFYMTRNKDWKETWLVNVTRTMHFKDGKCLDFTWSPLQSKFLEPSVFRRLGGFPVRRPEEDVASRAAFAEIECAEEDGLHGQLRFSVFAGQGGTYRIETSPGTVVEKELREGENAVAVPCMYPKNGRFKTHFRVTKVGTDSACERDFPVRVDFQPVRVKLTTPAYRNNFYPGQDVSKVCGNVTVAGREAVSLRFEGPGFPTRMAELPAGGGAFSFDTAGFAKGDAVLTVRNGEVVEKVKIRNLPPSGRRMTWIEDGCLVVDGKRVFRRGFYALNYKMGRAALERFNAERASFKLTEELCDGPIVEPERLVNGIERKEGIYDVEPSRELLDKIDAVVDRATKECDFGLWFLLDEPECRNISPIWCNHLYRHLAEKDPYHIIYTDSRNGKPTIDYVDYVQTHPYIAPINADDGRRYGVQIADVGSYLDAFDAWGRPEKCVGQVPMAFAYRWTSIRNDYPTFDEYRASTWAGVVRGSKGMNVYAGHDLGDRPQLWQGSRFVFESVAALEDFFIWGKLRHLQKSKSTEVAHWTLNGEQLLVAVNFTKDPQTAAFADVTGDFSEFRGERKTSLSGGGSLALGPFEVLILTTKTRDAGLECRADCVARIAKLEYERTHRDNQLLERYDDIVVDSNMESNFGGGSYKLFDGTHEMIARESKGRLNPFVEMSFANFRPRFRKVRVYGWGLDAMTVEIRRDGAWMELAPVSVRTEKYMRELDFGETISTVRMRLSFPAKAGAENAVEIYEVELPSVGDAAAESKEAEVAAIPDEGVVPLIDGRFRIAKNEARRFPKGADARWLVMDIASLAPQPPGNQYQSWHASLDTGYVLASLGGSNSEAGIYTIRLDPPPQKEVPEFIFRDYGLFVDVNHVSLMTKPASRVELSGPEGRSEIVPGDTVTVSVHFATPCEDVAAELLHSRYFNTLHPFKYDGQTNAIALKPLDAMRCHWGAQVKIEQCDDYRAHAVYVRATALGGGPGRPLLGNFAVPFKSVRD
ncbi:MAG: hypothetical protein IJG13_15530 [Kiritimatiellae bacterium]|nr:hypothetical protein [Kiritimatiellia bacterium]